ncbi:glycosyltransferase [Metabacillus sp. KIGAM252]|uniref:Glycosyltransferase n=1 Tax=Metabacillus flavus TaxID=2823519 RepID=A0ABS5LFX1_9BACI|nr:glycosyltransferase [Metabacillus flavus]MBS2969650.1 glycosyltransferase [Metabacillus flavus]
MKKKLLFVIPSLEAGGGEKSLVNLLSQIDYSQYQVDLLLFKESGIFLPSIPAHVKIIGLQESYQLFILTLFSSVRKFVMKKQFQLAYARIAYSASNRLLKNKAYSEQVSWKFISKSLNFLDKEYDAAIGYLEKSSIYFIVDKVKANKKIGWIHTNYSSSGLNKDYDNPFFEKLDHIITVSEECAVSLKETFSTCREKIKVIQNIVSPAAILKLADQRTASTEKSNEQIKIVTVGRLSHEKGIDLAIQACMRLIERGYKVKWEVLGEGPEREKLEKLIELSNLEKNFFLLGVKDNPYPYIKEADIYVQPSRYEGKSIAIDEAKILGKPIVVTNFDTAKDQISTGINGLIVEKSVEGICNGIERLTENKELLAYITRNLSAERLGTEEEIKKLYKLI